jgi:HEAT repeat protein
MRCAVAEALGQSGRDQVVGLLIAALRDKDWRVRWRVAEALGQSGRS